MGFLRATKHLRTKHLLQKSFTAERPGSHHLDQVVRVHSISRGQVEMMPPDQTH